MYQSIDSLFCFCCPHADIHPRNTFESVILFNCANCIKRSFHVHPVTFVIFALFFFLILLFFFLILIPLKTYKNLTKAYQFEILNINLSFSIIQYLIKTHYSYYKLKSNVYLQNNRRTKPFVRQNTPVMKNKILALTMLALTAIAISSCYSSRKGYGCPMNTQSSSRFRG